MGKIKCLLINPSQSYYKGNYEFNVYFPLGLYSIQANSPNLDIDIYDCLVESFTVKKNGKKIIYGSPIKKIIDHISKTKPKFIGISCPFTAQFSNSIRLAIVIHHNFPNIKIIFGGPGVSYNTKKILQKFPFINFCIKGEGEKAFALLIKNIKNQDKLIDLPNLVFFNKNKFVDNPIKPIINLDGLLPIDYSKINFKKYLQHPYIYKHRSTIPRDSFSIITSRGCPFQCNFCSINLHMTRVYRTHSPEYIFQQIKTLHQKHSINNFHFEDDNISQNPKRFERLLDLIINNNLKIRWDTPNGIRIDTLNDTLIKKIKKSGCDRLTVAIESGSQKTIDKVIHKNLNLNTAIKIIKKIHQNKVNLSAFFIIGFPEETKKDMMKTARLAIKLSKKYHLYSMLFVAIPLPGTSLYQQCLKENLLSHKIREKNISQSSQQNGKYLINSYFHSHKDITFCLEFFYKNTKPKINLKHLLKTKILSYLYPNYFTNSTK